MDLFGLVHDFSYCEKLFRFLSCGIIALCAYFIRLIDFFCGLSGIFTLYTRIK